MDLFTHYLLLADTNRPHIFDTIFSAGAVTIDAAYIDGNRKSLLSLIDGRPKIVCAQILNLLNNSETFVIG